MRRALDRSHLDQSQLDVLNRSMHGKRPHLPKDSNQTLVKKSLEECTQNTNIPICLRTRAGNRKMISTLASSDSGGNNMN